MAPRLNATALRRRLAGLPALLGTGFVLIVIAFAWLLWHAGQSEHQVPVSVAKKLPEKIESSGMPPELGIEEKEEIRAMLKKMPASEGEDFERQVWLKDMQQLIRPRVSSDKEAVEIASWVYAYSRHFDLSPELILGVIAVESGFDRFALSSAGAIGLMQVMPFWKEELGSPEDNLLDIETNIRYGCAIIRHYLDRQQRLDRALAAYNGSRGHTHYAVRVFEAMQRFKTGG